MKLECSTFVFKKKVGSCTHNSCDQMSLNPRRFNLFSLFTLFLFIFIFFFFFSFFFVSFVFSFWVVLLGLFLLRVVLRFSTPFAWGCLRSPPLGGAAFLLSSGWGCFFPCLLLGGASWSLPPLHLGGFEQKEDKPWKSSRIFRARQTTLEIFRDLMFSFFVRYRNLTTTISHDNNNHRTSKHASKSWTSDGPPSCLGGSSHGWVPVKNPQYIRAHFGGEAVGCSPTPQHTTMSPRQRNTITTW